MTLRACLLTLALGAMPLAAQQTYDQELVGRRGAVVKEWMAHLDTRPAGLPTFRAWTIHEERIYLRVELKGPNSHRDGKPLWDPETMRLWTKQYGADLGTKYGFEQVDFVQRVTDPAAKMQFTEEGRRYMTYKSFKLPPEKFDY